MNLFGNGSLNTSEVNLATQDKFFGGGLSISLLISAFIGLISSMGSFINIQFYLKLNSYLKWVLRIFSIIMLICNTTIIVGSIMMAYEDFQSHLTCGMIILPTTVNALTLLNSLAIISGVRFYMYSKSLKAEIAEKKYLLLIIIGGITSNQIIINGTLLLSMYFKVPTLTTLCANIAVVEYGHLKPLTPGVIVTTGLLQLVLTLYFDIKMIFTMRKQHEANIGNGQDALVPWKSSNENVEEDLKVPIMATLISTGLLLLGLLVVGVAISAILLDHGVTQWITRLTMNTVPSVTLPLILLFTIKRKKEEVQKQPPKGLQFHENVPKCNGLQFHDDPEDQKDEQEESNDEPTHFTVKVEIENIQPVQDIAGEDIVALQVLERTFEEPKLAKIKKNTMPEVEN